MRQSLRTASVLGLGAALVAAMGACSSSGGGAPAVDTGAVTLTVADRPGADQAANRTYFDAQVAAFQKANPNVTLQPSETVYDPQTFGALAAGGKLPDVMTVPFTDPPGLIARKQIADISDAVKADGLVARLNPATLAVAQDSSGKTFGVPTGAYSVGLVYNRALFTKAGLDPNRPPATWDEVRADAKAITEKTGVAGYAQMANNGCGGWMFTALTYAFGGRVENKDGTKTTFAATDGSKNALQLIHDMRWDDKSMGTNALYDCGTIQKDFAAGKVGMYLSAPDNYFYTVNNYKMNKNDYGQAGMPLYQGHDNGTLAGGQIQIISPSATAAQRLAAVKWIDFFYLKKFADQPTALAQASSQFAVGNPVGLPALSVVSSAQQDQYDGWVKAAGYVNVPTEHFTAYVARAKGQAIIAEPVNKAQEVYKALDTVIQSVLTQPNTDIDTLLKEATTTVDAKLGR